MNNRYRYNYNLIMNLVVPYIASSTEHSEGVVDCKYTLKSVAVCGASSTQGKVRGTWYVTTLRSTAIHTNLWLGYILHGLVNVLCGYTVMVEDMYVCM